MNGQNFYSRQRSVSTQNRESNEERWADLVSGESGWLDHVLETSIANEQSLGRHSRLSVVALDWIDDGDSLVLSGSEFDGFGLI